MSARGVVDGVVRFTPGVAGWYLTLDMPADRSSCRAELRDVSPVPGPLPKWIEEVPNVAATTTLLLEPSRYAGTHTYRMTLICGLREIARGLVHLAAPRDGAILQHFTVERASAPEPASEIAIISRAPARGARCGAPAR
jgi:hypothetical protein